MDWSVFLGQLLVLCTIPMDSVLRGLAAILLLWKRALWRSLQVYLFVGPKLLSQYIESDKVIQDTFNLVYIKKHASFPPLVQTKPNIYEAQLWQGLNIALLQELLSSLGKCQDKHDWSKGQ